MGRQRRRKIRKGGERSRGREEMKRKKRRKRKRRRKRRRGGRKGGIGFVQTQTILLADNAEPYCVTD